MNKENKDFVLQHERRPPSSIYLFVFVFYIRLRAVFVFAGFQLANISIQLGLYCYMLLPFFFFCKCRDVFRSKSRSVFLKKSIYGSNIKIDILLIFKQWV